MVEDKQIVALFLERDEQGLRAARDKYGNYCYSIACNILDDRQDAEECVNDTYLAAWCRIPPCEPVCLSAFLGKIARNLALKRYRENTALKRGGGTVTLSLEELSGCIPTGHSFDERLQAQELADLISRFLRSLPETERRIFVRRYWGCESIGDISQKCGFSQSKVKMMLLRTRRKLQTYLTEEGIFYEEK